MAKQGLSTFKHALLLNEALKTYGSPQITSGAIEVKPTINYNDAPLYSDDRLKYKNQSFKDGKLDLTIDYSDKSILAPLMGKTSSAVSFSNGGTTVNSTKYISNMSDIPNAVGFAYIVNDFDVNNKVNKFVVKHYYKVEFASETEDAKTQEGTVSYTYSVLTGIIYALEDGTFMEEVSFDTKADAVAYIDTLFLATASEVVVSLASGTYTALQAQDVTLTTATSGATIYYTQNGTTPSATNGSTYSAPIDISASCGLKAIAIKSGLANSTVTSREYIITA